MQQVTDMILVKIYRVSFILDKRYNKQITITTYKRVFILDKMYNKQSSVRGDRSRSWCG